MRKNLIKIDEKKLKDYLLIASRIPDIPESKLGLVLNKLLNTEDKKEKQVIEKFLIESFLKFVIYIANKYRGAGYSFAKLIKFGNMGLIKTVKEWEKTKDENFIQILIWNVEGEIINGILKEKKLNREQVK
jgi:DNA-directed RNA polymerase sigma subunit (sigma70/sigma32)